MKFLFFTISILSGVCLFAKAPDLSDKQICTPPPKIIRTCCSFGAEVSFANLPFTKVTSLTSMEMIGPHEYLGGKQEGNGIIYSQHGGFIDVAHTRDVADWTAFLFVKILEAQESESMLTIALPNEGGKKELQLSIPPYLDKHNAALLAGKIAYDISMWHEIATWFGASYVPFVPERYSSFSPEDLYSNLLGAELGIAAVESALPYEEAMTQLLEARLKKMKAGETEQVTWDATEAVRNIWWTNEKTLPSKDVLIERYFGGQNHLIPWLLPTANSKTERHLIEIPNSETYSLDEFYTLQLRVNKKFPDRLMNEFPEDRLINQKDFPYLINYVQQEVLEDKILSGEIGIVSRTKLDSSRP